MKISRVRATPINVPLEAAYVWSYGTLPGFTQAIIEVETEEGLTGIGEAPSAAAADIINSTFAEALAGRDPIDITGCELRCLPSTRGVPDNIVTNIAGHGGFTATLKFIGACEKMGIGFWCYSGDSSVATAAYMHLCASHICADGAFL